MNVTVKAADNLTQGEVERGVTAKGTVVDIKGMGCMCGVCSPGKARTPCPHCKEISGAPAQLRCRHCGYPLKSKRLR